MPYSRCTGGLALLLAAACIPKVTEDTPVTTSAATIARFAPDAADPCQSVLPFPTDLAKNPVTGKLDVPFCPTDSAEQLALKAGLRTLDGYALGVTLTAPLSGSVNADSVKGAVKLFVADTGTPVDVAAQLSSTGVTLLIQPTKPLTERTRYVAVVTTDLVDHSLTPVSSDVVFVFLKSQEPLVDANGYSRFAALSDAEAHALEPLRLAYVPLFDALAAKGLTRDRVAVAWSFTTQTVHASLPKLAGLVTARGGASVVHDGQLPAAQHPLLAAAGIPVANVCDVHTGRVTLQNLEAPSGTFAADDAGVPRSAPLTIGYVLTTPNLDAPAACTTPWPGDKLVVFAHSLGRCKNDSLALANAFAKAGFAVLALDGPRSGSRSVENLGDQDLDGCPDQPSTPSLLALPGQSVNPFALRDGLREWGLELSQVLALARTQAFRFAGRSTGAAQAKVALVGHSWGGMAASLAGSLGSVDVVALDAASAELGAVLAPGVRAATAATLADAGVDVSSDAGTAELDARTAAGVAAFRWVLEPADPLYAAPATPSTLPVLVQVVSAGSGDAPLHATATQLNLDRAYGRAPPAETTFDLTASGAPLCDSPSAAVGALLKPCIANTAAAGYPAALAKTAALQRQLVTFVATGLAGAPVLCSTDLTVACP